MDIVIKSGLVVTASDTYRADIGINGERIASIGQDLVGEKIIDARNRLVFPGFVDPHVHLQMPAGGIISTDSFFTGTVAAACGGTTTIIDFIETDPSGSLLEAAAARRAAADPQVTVDYSLHLTGNMVSPTFLDDVGTLAGQGYTSLKLYTTYVGLMVHDAEILELLGAAKTHGLLPLVHAENDAIIARLQRELLAAGRIEPRFHPVSRPPIAEAEAAYRVLALARVADVPVYFVHVSCIETLEAIHGARASAQTVFVEVTPQHLLLDEVEYARPCLEGVSFCCAPPLRARRHRDALWAALASGAIQTVATDHCTWDRKTRLERGGQDFTRIPNGLPGIETRIPLLYSDGVGRGQLTLQRFVDACATAPAKLFGLYPRKGSVTIGGDADLVIYEPERKVVLSQAALHQTGDYCPYEGWPLRGYPELVLSRGRIVAREGQFVGEAGAGRFVARRRFPWKEVNR
jgi:dihydropyrimidinase